MKNVFAIILIVTSIGLFQYFIDPTYQEVKDLRAQEADFNEALNNTEKVQEIRDLLLTKYNSFSPEDLKRLEKLLPDNIDNVRLIIEIDKIASRHDLALKDVQVTETQPRASASVVAAGSEGFAGNEARYGTAPLAFSLVGDYAAFLSFLRDVERGLRLMDITNITIKPNEEPTRYEYGLNIQTYWLKPVQ